MPVVLWVVRLSYLVSLVHKRSPPLLTYAKASFMFAKKRACNFNSFPHETHEKHEKLLFPLRLGETPRPTLLRTGQLSDPKEVGRTVSVSREFV